MALVTAACAASTSDPQPAEVPVQPLVVGTSAPVPIAVAPAEKPVVEESTGVATSPLAVVARDPRLARAPRPRALVVTELAQLERLFAASTVGSPDRPNLLRRLAEDYGELARTADGSVASAARKKSLDDYQLLVDEAPNDPHVDEALYYAGLERELSGDKSSARKLYYELIKRTPQSKLVPLAYFAFGELFFAEAVADPAKNDLAEQAYKEVVKYPPPANTIYDEAKRRLGEIATRRRGVTRP